MNIMQRHYLVNTKKKLGDGLYGMKHVQYGRQLWTECKVRKDHVCVISQKPIKKGEAAYRPISNAGNRYERIACAFFEANR